MRKVMILFLLIAAFAHAPQGGDYGSLTTAEERNNYLQQNVATGLTADVVTVSGSKITLTRSPGDLELQSGYSGEIIMNGKSANIKDNSGQYYSFKSASKVVVEGGIIKSIQNAELINGIDVGGTTLTGSGVSYDFSTKQGTIGQDGTAARVTIDGITYTPDYGKEIYIDGKASPPVVSGKSFTMTKNYGPIEGLFKSEPFELYKVQGMGNSLGYVSYDSRSDTFKIESQTQLKRDDHYIVRDTSSPGESLHIGRSEGSCLKVSGHPMCLEFNDKQKLVDVLGQSGNAVQLSYNMDKYGIRSQSQFMDNTRLEIYRLAENSNSADSFSKKALKGILDKSGLNTRGAIPNSQISYGGLQGKQDQYLRQIEGLPGVKGTVCNDPSCPVTYTGEEPVDAPKVGYATRIINWFFSEQYKKPIEVDPSQHQSLYADVQRNIAGSNRDSKIILYPSRIQLSYGNVAYVPGAVYNSNGDKIREITVQQTVVGPDKVAGRGRSIAYTLLD